MLDMKVKTVLLPNRMPTSIIDETIQKAIPENSYVYNYIFNSHDGRYYCHIIYSEMSTAGFGSNFYADGKLTVE